MNNDGASKLKEFIQDLKSSISLRKFIKDFVFYEPEKDGIKDYRANCPTNHGSSSGACFVVNDDIMFCHSCGRYWDSISLAQEFKTNGDFMLALQLCAKWGGIPLPDGLNLKAYALKNAKKQKLIELFEKYLEFISKEMNQDMYDLCYKKWGLDKKTILKLKIGLTTSAITKKMLDDGYSEVELRSSGLFIKTNNGLQPFFLGRLTFPYMTKGQPRYFIGRKTALTLENKFEHPNTKNYPAIQKKNLT